MEKKENKLRTYIKNVDLKRNELKIITGFMTAGMVAGSVTCGVIGHDISKNYDRDAAVQDKYQHKIESTLIDAKNNIAELEEWGVISNNELVFDDHKKRQLVQTISAKTMEEAEAETMTMDTKVANNTFKGTAVGTVGGIAIGTLLASGVNSAMHGMQRRLRRKEQEEREKKYCRLS